jgi:Phosphate transporter family
MSWRASRSRMLDATALPLILTIAVALIFDLTNGFHDTANSVATTVGTRALPPRIAIAFAAILNLVGAVVATQILNAKVANTIGDLVGREKKFIFCPTVASDGKVARAKKFCRGFAHSISGLLIHESPRRGIFSETHHSLVLFSGRALVSTSPPSRLNGWIKPAKLRSGLAGGEAPVDARLLLVARLIPGPRLPP